MSIGRCNRSKGKSPLDAPALIMINLREPRLQDLLADPIICIVMKRDGVSLESLLALLSTTAARVSPAAHTNWQRDLARAVDAR
jgi:hypothetical protein